MAATFKGIAFPFSKGTTSFPAEAEDAALIRQSIIQILLTSKGERVMRPSFGSGVQAAIFENNDALLDTLVEAEVFSSIGKFETRVIVRGIAVERPKEGEIVVTISYTIKLTRYNDTVSLNLATP